jgi:hypothetical protein
MDNKRNSNLHMFIRSLTPSFIGLIGYISFGILLVIIHVLILSLKTGSLIPSNLNYSAPDYSNSTIRSLQKILNGKDLSRLPSLILLGFAILLLIALLTQLYKLIKSWNQSRSYINNSGQVSVGAHPVQSSIYTQVLLKFIVLIVACGMYIIARPFFHYLLSLDNQLFKGTFTTQKIIHEVAAVIGWMLVAHITIVLLRLYFSRSRLHDDDSIYYS